MDEQEGHEAKADEVERSLDDMQQQSEHLGGEIEGADDEWERKKRDPAVPGAAGMPSETGGPEPEAEYPNKAPEDGDEDQDDASGEDGDGDPDDASGDDEDR